VKNATDVVKTHYCFGSKIWEEWKESKKYIQNHLNPNWSDPSLLKSGYNISSLLQFVRESSFHFEANKDAKDNVRCYKKREKVRGNATWRDVKNVVYNDKYSNKMDKMKKEGWYPDCWFSFLAFGAPSKIPSPSLYIVRIKTEELPTVLGTASKIKFKDLTIVDAIDSLTPTQDSEIHIHSKGKKFTTNTFVDEDNCEDEDTPSSFASMNSIRKIKQEDTNKSTPKIDHKQLAKSMKMKTQQQSFAKMDNKQFIDSRIVCDPLTKLKANLTDLQESYKTYRSGEFGDVDETILQLMQEEIQSTTKDLFMLARCQRLQNTVSIATSSSSSSSSSSSTATPSETRVFYNGI